MTRKRKPHPQRSSHPSNTAPQVTHNNNNNTLVPGKPNGYESLRRNSKNSDGQKFDSPGLIFPVSTPWVVFAAVLLGRIIYVSQIKNWWILHPDEVFQSVEVAFSELHGYGFRAYEFLPPPGEQRKSHARQQEANLGMHSLRSFLYPRVFVLVMLVGEWFCIQPYLMAKVFHAAVTSVLPLATYFFTATVFRCHDIASLASILVGFSVHLTVFGTHTLMNSFFAPVVLLCLVPILENLLAAGKRTQGGSESMTDSAEGNYRPVGNGFGEISETNGNHNLRCNGYHHDLVYRVPEASGRITGEWNRAAVLFLAGIALGITCYIRIDLVLFVALILAPHCLRTQYNQVLLTLDLHVILPVLLGFTSGMLVGGLEDLWSYGVWFISPYQWLRFNVGFDFATLLFGKQDLDFYLQGIFFHNISLITLFATFITVMAFGVISSDFRKSHGRSLTMLLKLFVSSVLLFIIYSLKGHKELRFVHNPLVLLIIVYSSAIVLILKYVASRDWPRTYVKGSVYFCICLYMYNQWCAMPSAADQSNKAWVYNSGWDSNHVNDCFEFISRQPDVSGVFVDRSIHTSAAFSVLRHDVPLLALIHYELYEFDSSAYLPVKAVTPFARKDTVNVRTLSSISNYISIYNSHEYLLKFLLSQTKYNYLVMKKDKTFMNQGYELVHTSGTMKVLRRTYDRSAEEYLDNVAKNLPVGSNATILEYEGSWLLTFGLLELAEERLLTALQLGNPSARLFQILVKTFLELKKLDHARKAEHLCIDLLGVEVCRTPQPRIILHKDYDIALPR